MRTIHLRRHRAATRHRPCLSGVPSPGQRSFGLVTLEGEIDMATAGHVRGRLAEAVDEHPHVAVDLARVTFIDCAILGVLVDARQRALRRNHTIGLAAPSPTVTAMLRLTGLDTVFPIFTTHEEARVRMGRSR